MLNSSISNNSIYHVICFHSLNVKLVLFDPLIGRPLQVRVLHIPESSSITGASLSDNLMS